MFSRDVLFVCLLLVLIVNAQRKRRTKNGERLTCDFEESMCRIKQDKTDDGRWIRWNGDGDIGRMETPSDQLNNNDTGYFMYAYSSGISRLMSPEYQSVGTGGPRCLTFWYNIFGHRKAGTLSVYQSLNETYFGEPIWQVTGDMGNVWRPIEMDLTSDHTFKVVFEANRGNDISISIDNVLISDNACPGGIYSLDPRITCDFENEDLCGYEQDLSDDVDWKRYSAQDGVSGDGPDEDHTFGEDYGFYICMDQRRVPKLPGHRAHIISPVFNTTAENDGHCIKFWYFLSGYEVGDIEAFLYYDDMTEVMFRIQDDQSDVWHRGYFQAPTNVTSFRIGFQSIRGQGEGIHCIDDVEVFEGSCDMLLTTVVPVVTTPEPVVDNANCDFEIDCMYPYPPEQSAESGWIRSYRGSHSYRRLPTVDHTLGTTDGHYMHTTTETDYDIITMRTLKMSRRNNTKCLQFYYVINSVRNDYLNVYIDDSAISGLPTDPIWAQYSSTLYAKWTMAQIDIQPTEGDFSVVFKAMRVTGSSYDNYSGVDVAIDDIAFFDQECSSVTAAPWHSPIDCDFESDDLCGYQNTFIQHWTRINGSTPSVDTGPHTDHTLNAIHGHYMYMEASNHAEGTKAKLVTPTIHKFDGPMCLQFWYNMYGDDVGYLRVYRINPNSAALWAQQGDQGREWKLGEVAVNLVSSYSTNTYVDTAFQVAFEAELSKGYRGDIAIDDVKLLPYACDSVAAPKVVKSVDCDLEAGAAGCGFTWDTRNPVWAYYDYRTTDVIERSSIFPKRLESEFNSFMYYDKVPYNSRISLITPPLVPAPEHCLTFSHILKQSHLAISVQTSTENIDIITIKKEYSPLWTSIQIPLVIKTTEPFKVVFEAKYSSYTNFIALDNIKLVPGKCQDTVPVEKLHCDFEKDCRFVVNMTDTEDAAWQISNKDTSHSSLLPAYDNTFGTPSGHFFFIKFERTYNGENRQLLRTPMIRQKDSNRKRCLQFHYYMDSYKTNMMNVYIEDATSGGRLPVDPIWRTYGSENVAQWIKASVDILPNEGDFSIVFEPVMVAYQYSAIGIDDVMILRQKCSKVIEQEWKSTVDCDFEKDNVCGYSPPNANIARSDFTWQTNAGMTKTRETGPNTDHTFELSDAKQGVYMYMETSPPQKPGDVAILASPLIPAANTSVCLEFWYSMFGEDTGTLEVYRSQPAISTDLRRYRYERLWRKEGQRSKRWLKAEVPLNTNYNKEDSNRLIEHTSQIHFKGTVGYGYRGDIAIDDVKLILKSCEPVPKTKEQSVPVNETKCDFEKGVDGCGFEDMEEEGSGAEWNYFNVSSIKFDPTIENDDPRVNMSKGQKSFIFADASELRAGERVVIMTPSVSANQEYCLAFSYVTMADFIINIYSRQSSGEEEFIHQLTGEDIANWTTNAVYIRPHLTPFKIVFEGVIGRDDEGFLALDDVNVQDGKCPTEPPRPVDSNKGVVDDFKKEPAEDNSQSTISTVVIALLTIALFIAFAFVIFLILVIKRYRQNASSSNSMIIEDAKSEDKSSNCGD